MHEEKKPASFGSTHSSIGHIHEPTGSSILFNLVPNKGPVFLFSLELQRAWLSLRGNLCMTKANDFRVEPDTILPLHGKMLSRRASLGWGGSCRLCGHSGHLLLFQNNCHGQVSVLSAARHLEPAIFLGIWFTENPYGANSAF